MQLRSAILSLTGTGSSEISLVFSPAGFMNYFRSHFLLGEISSVFSLIVSFPELGHSLFYYITKYMFELSFDFYGFTSPIL